eukprot:c23390_g1_i1 orf=228-1007(-)
MSSTQILRNRNASEAQRRPVLRSAGNTTTVSRKVSSLLSKPVETKIALASHKGTSPKLSKPTTQEQIPRRVQNVLCDGQREDGEKRPETRRILGTTGKGSKNPASERKVAPSRRNSITVISRFGIESSPGGSLESLSSEEVSMLPLSVDSGVKKGVAQLSTGMKVAGPGSKQQAGLKVGRVVPDVLLSTMAVPVEVKKRCGWITPQSGNASFPSRGSSRGGYVRNVDLITICLSGDSQYLSPLLIQGLKDSKFDANCIP